MSFTALGYLFGRWWPALVFAAGAMLVGLVVAAITTYGHSREDDGYARGHAEYVALQAKMAERAASSEREQRETEQRRAAAMTGVLDAKERELQRVRADLAVSDAAAGRLRQRVESLIATARSRAASSDPAPAPGGPATDDAAGMLADVLGRCVAHVRQLAAVADERGAAGRACERIADALSNTN